MISLFYAAEFILLDIVIANLFKDTFNDTIELSTPQYNERQPHQEVKQVQPKVSALIFT